MNSVNLNELLQDCSLPVLYHILFDNYFPYRSWHRIFRELFFFIDLGIVFFENYFSYRS